jgi:hypothetical protein
MSIPWVNVDGPKRTVDTSGVPTNVPMPPITVLDRPTTCR